MKKTRTSHLLCSCCGQYIDWYLEFENTSEYALYGYKEGNHCERCFNEVEYKAWFNFVNIRDKVLHALSPINKIKFLYSEKWEQLHVIDRLTEMGCITYSIR